MSASRPDPISSMEAHDTRLQGVVESLRLRAGIPPGPGVADVPKPRPSARTCEDSVRWAGSLPQVCGQDGCPAATAPAQR
jgi:hypothetical protein